MKICGNKSILINQIYPDNFEGIWNVLKPLLKDPSTYNDTTVKQQLLDLVVLRDNVGEALWYIYTAILVSSIVYYNLATRGCVKDPNAIKADYDEYLKKQEETDNQAAVNNSTVYTVS
jgi:hypothetical protein